MVSVSVVLAYTTVYIKVASQVCTSTAARTMPAWSSIASSFRMTSHESSSKNQSVRDSLRVIPCPCASHLIVVRAQTPWNLGIAACTNFSECGRRRLRHDIRQRNGDIVRRKDIIDCLGRLFGLPSQRWVNSLLYKPRPYLILPRPKVEKSVKVTKCDASALCLFRSSYTRPTIRAWNRYTAGRL